MPTLIVIAVILTTVSITVMSVTLVVATIHFRTKVDAMEKNVAQVATDLSSLIQDSRGLVKEMQQVTTQVSKQMADVEQMTQTARGWTERADRIIEAVGSVAEPPLFFLSKNFKTFGGVVSGVLHVLRNFKR